MRILFNKFIRQKKRKSKYKLGDLVRTADKKNVKSKGNTRIWSYKLHKITQIINDTIPSYRINILPQRYNDALLWKTDLTMEENIKVMKKLNIILD